MSEYIPIKEMIRMNEYLYCDCDIVLQQKVKT